MGRDGMYDNSPELLLIPSKVDGGDGGGLLKHLAHNSQRLFWLSRPLFPRHHLPRLGRTLFR